jgi:hypothetical protein
VEWNFRDPHIIYPSSKPSHHCSIKIGVVFVLVLVDKIEVPDYQPWPSTLNSDIPQFLKEMNLVLILLGAYTQVNHHALPSDGQKRTETL